MLTEHEIEKIEERLGRGVAALAEYKEVCLALQTVKRNPICRFTLLVWASDEPDAHSIKADLPNDARPEVNSFLSARERALHAQITDLLKG